MPWFFKKSLGHRKNLEHSQIQKKSRQIWLSPNLTLRKDLYMDTAFNYSFPFCTLDSFLARLGKNLVYCEMFLCPNGSYTSLNQFNKAGKIATNTIIVRIYYLGLSSHRPHCALALMVSLHGSAILRFKRERKAKDLFSTQVFLTKMLCLWSFWLSATNISQWLLLGIFVQKVFEANLNR